ncbi:MAG: flavodoxin family protein, partial [Lachnospiraceae bacterium]
MKIQRVVALYWSATGNTASVVKRIGQELAHRLACPMEVYDFTLQKAREDVQSFGTGDFVVVGSPTYAGTLPNKILPDFQT